jgi:hypothetical protein
LTSPPSVSFLPSHFRNVPVVVVLFGIGLDCSLSRRRHWGTRVRTTSDLEPYPPCSPLPTAPAYGDSPFGLSLRDSRDALALLQCLLHSVRPATRRGASERRLSVCSLSHLRPLNVFEMKQMFFVCRDVRKPFRTGCESKCRSSEVAPGLLAGSFFSSVA